MKTPPTPTLCLSPGVHAVAIGDDLVLLDIHADAYMCAPGAAAAVHMTPGSSAVVMSQGPLLSDLLASRLLRANALPEGRLAPPPLPTRSALTDLTDPPTARDFAQAPVALFDLLRGYHRRGFATIVANARSRADRLEIGPSAALLATVARFHRWAPYAPVSGKCLLRSFLLLQVLRRAGLDARWVFGVATWPFRAHCWLQVDDMALDDHADRLRAYAPIMVV